MAVIIFKPIEKCNSNCIYCDVVTRKDQQAVMSFELLEIVFKNINEYLLSKPDDKLSLIWHGGEPLLLGVDYFKKALEFQEKHCSQTKNRLEHAMQSNLTLINQDFIDVLKEMGINTLGTSYDPEPHVRGGGADRDTAAYNKKFFKGLNLLEENNIGFGFIYVVTKKSIQKPLDVFHVLSNFKLSGGFMMNPVLIYGDDKNDIAITPEEYCDFLGTIFPYWYKHKDRFPMVDPFNNMMRNVRDKQISLGCSDAGDCAYHYAYIGPKGEASQCGRAGDWGIISYGNIKDRSLIDIYNDKSRDILVERTEMLPEGDCKDCRFWYICHGGCPLDAYSKHNEFLRKSSWCEAKKGFLEKYFEPITGLKAEQHESKN